MNETECEIRKDPRNERLLKAIIIDLVVINSFPYYRYRVLYNIAVIKTSYGEQDTL